MWQLIMKSTIPNKTSIYTHKNLVQKVLATSKSHKLIEGDKIYKKIIIKKREQNQDNINIITKFLDWIHYN